MRAFRFKEIGYLTPYFFGSDGVNGVLEFFAANSRFVVYFGPNFLLQLVVGGFGVRIL